MADLDALDLTKLNALGAQLAASADARHLIVGAVGTGRSTLARMLAEKVSEARLIEVPQEGLDRPLHLLAQLGAEDPQRLPDVLGGQTPFPQRLEGLLKQNAPLVVVAPSRWGEPFGLAPEPDPVEHLLQDAIQQMWTQYSGPIYLFQDEGRLAAATSLRLERIQVNEHFLEDSQTWGPLLSFATRLAGKHEQHVSPIVLRLAVGLLALKAAFNEVQPLLNEKVDARAIETLAHKIHQQLPKRMFPIAQALCACRGHFEQELVTDLLQRHHVENQAFWTTWFSQCLGYGRTRIRITSVVRHVFLAASPARPTQRTPLIDYYRARDGATQPGQLQTCSVVPWLERVYHLGLSSEANHQDEWREIVDRWGSPREWLWVRARFLSRQHRFEEAAELYRQCLDKEPNDSYSWHYWAYNRERAGCRDSETENAYLNAVRQDPTNPRWNQRAIRFLVRRSKLEEARALLGQAEARFAAAKPAFRQLDFYQREFYYRIIYRLLKSGKWSFALELLEQLPPDTRPAPHFATLRQLAEDQKEVSLLGEAVYPAAYPIERRWKFPAELSAQGLEASRPWFPGRVLESSVSEVHFVFATPEGRLEDRELYDRTYSAEEWEQRSGQSAGLAEGFWFLGQRQDQSEVLAKAEYQSSKSYYEYLFSAAKLQTRLH